jgi:hypothetical protein
MSNAILEGFGEAVKEIDESEFEHKLEKLGPFDFVNSINFKKENYSEDPRVEKQYNPFIVNRNFGMHVDSVLQANEMNKNFHLDNKMQYDYLMDSIKFGKRQWLKKKEDENIEIIQKFFGYSFMKAKETLSLLNDDKLDLIKSYLSTSKGGKV